MELVCPICGEPAKRGTPIDKNQQMPLDRIHWSHKDRSALCPVLGVTANGQTGYVPALPMTPRR
jgi:hypothetical protein